MSLKDALGSRYVFAKDTDKSDDDDTPMDEMYEPIIPDYPTVEPIAEADEIQH